MSPQRRPIEPPLTGVLDWRDASHWSERPLPCRYCTKPTNLRDSRRKPAHKVCAEAALAQQLAEQAESYENERRRLRDRQQELPNPPQG